MLVWCSDEIVGTKIPTGAPVAILLFQNVERQCQGAVRAANNAITFQSSKLNPGSNKLNPGSSKLNPGSSKLLRIKVTKF